MYHMRLKENTKLVGQIPVSIIFYGEISIFSINMMQIYYQII